MTAISVWERKKEKKKGVEAYDGYWGMMDITVIKGIRARGEFDVALMIDDVMSMMMTMATFH